MGCRGSTSQVHEPRKVSPTNGSWSEGIARGELSSGDPTEAAPRSFSSTAPAPTDGISQDLGCAFATAPLNDSPPPGPRLAADNADLTPRGLLDDAGSRVVRKRRDAGVRAERSGATVGPPEHALMEPPSIAHPPGVPAGSPPRVASPAYPPTGCEADDSVPPLAPRSSSRSPSHSPRVAAVMQAEAALALLADDDDEDDEDEKRRTGQPSWHWPHNDVHGASGCETFREVAKAPNFPDHVEVSLSTRKLLLTWARWGRNSLRISQEQHFKALQHVRHPRTAPPMPPSPITSPQPTPQSTPRGQPPSRQSENSGLNTTASSSGFSPSLARVAARKDGLMNTSRAEPWMKRTTDSAPAALFDELKEEQREGMETQGMKNNLCKKLGADAAVPKSNGTPGFGVDTPGFGADVGSSRASAQASVVASVMSSGISSPQETGRLSPWILEAEALVNSQDDDDILSGLGRPATAAWGAAPASVESSANTVLGFPSVLDGDCGLGPLCEEILETIEDGDELEKVDLFVNVSTAAPSDVCGTASPGNSSTNGSRSDRTTDATPQRSVSADDACAGSHTQCNAADSSATEVKAAAALASVAPVAAGKASDNEQHVYQPGELVRYWSATRGIWMPARVVERRSRGVYLIDKQMRGCLGKVRAGDLISDVEERSNPVLRAVVALGPDDGEDEEEQQLRPKSRGGRSSSRSRNVHGASKSPVRSNSKGQTSPAKRIVGGAGSGDKPPQSPISAVGGTAVETRSPMSATKPLRPATPPHMRGRIVRDDFSDDSDD